MWRNPPPPQKIEIAYLLNISKFKILSDMQNIFAILSSTIAALVEKFWRISLYVTDGAFAKLYVMQIFVK